MFGLTRRATVRPSGPDALLVEPAGSPAFTFSVLGLPWVLFVRSGDSFGADEAGWWLFGAQGGRALALSAECAGLDLTVRGPLRATLDEAASRLWLDLADPPKALRGAVARAGWTWLDPAVTAPLRADPTAQPLPSVTDAPDIP